MENFEKKEQFVIETLKKSLPMLVLTHHHGVLDNLKH